MSQFRSQTTYDIQRPTGQCSFTGRKLEPGEPYMAVLVELDPADPNAKPDPAASKSLTPANALGFKRVDVSLDAWKAGNRPPNLFGFWKSNVQPPNQKRRLFVDDEILVMLFHRLEDAAEPDRLAFRFVLALILMRKRLLRYDGSVTREAPSLPGSRLNFWKVTPRGQENPVEVLNPQLDDAQIEQVTQQLGEILEAEL